jgi:predicted DNA-binding transcriptional regulator YafY
MTTTTTTTTGLPATWAVLEAALRQHRPVQVSYRGHQREISPHALGIKDRRAMLLAYQTNNHTNAPAEPADPQRQWRCMYLDQINDITPADPTHRWQTADNYNPDHPFPNIDHLAIAITPSPT